MKTYEGMFLVDNRHANRDWERVVSHVKESITKHGGEMVRYEKWGERKLAYPIKGHRRGTYLLAYFSAEADCVNRVYREVELSETLIRALILAIDSLPEGKAEAEAAAEGTDAAKGVGPSSKETPAAKSGDEKPAEPVAQAKTAGASSESKASEGDKGENPA